MHGRLGAAVALSLAMVAAQSHSAGAWQGGPAYLAYAGPYSSSPSSAFGHLFLVLPSNEHEALPLWDVVSFTADTHDAGPLRYVTIGIAGGFLGHYERLEFHQKTRDYQLLEDRDLWLVRLDLTLAQRNQLQEALALTEGRWYPYTFFEKNCAYYLQLLLARATGLVDVPSGFVSPTGVVEAVLQSGLAGTSYFRAAASRRLLVASGHVAPEVVHRLRRDEWTAVAADTAWLRGLQAADRLFVQEFFTWKELERKEPLAEGARAGRAILRVLNAEQAALEGEVPRSLLGLGMEIPGPVFHHYTRLRLGLLHGEGGAGRIYMRLRGALHDDADPTDAHRPVNSMELLAVEVSAGLDGLEPRIDALVLFSQRSLGPSDWLTSRRSWMIEAIARRGGVLSDVELHAEVRGGLGKTFRISEGVHVYGLATIAGVGTCCGRAALAAGAEAGVVLRPFRRWRASVRWTREHNVLNWRESQQRIRALGRHDLSRSLGLVLMAASGPGGEHVTVGFDWYP